MIGWWIVVSMQTPEERDLTDLEGRKRAILAQWETGVEGVRWLDDLTDAGKATRLSGGGYPNRYLALAGDVLPLLQGETTSLPREGVWVFGIDEGEEYALPPGWRGKVEMNADLIRTCPASHLLTIDCWDQS
ncbi:hypothetical protein [Deinococcus cellulosilyticus]|uniref:Uncharacterized protein n=1 Tax=Deinococcus cellulosilyticus (strain DSM 18568 / NBRC 106333 / KACC 11606 / 5516J-15) TaxID=1223518 RepID=A0A511N9E3_DEIC1|nr:hypothetical protein [Deinococcus cellulosilyticus]GEM49459.1 hypothetical protein DC3_50940 [Deinococcus cellulosilyticus NBRC 106333 = KACC 11606]